jgi:hypothetical protein
MNTALLFVCLTANMTAGQANETVFKSPLIEVKTDTYNGKTYSYVLYNRVYLGRQYHKSENMADLPRLPTTYFHDKSPIGVILNDPKTFPKKGSPPVMVLGMDIGTLAAYAQPGQTFHFTERVPTFVKLSFPDKGQKRYFSYVQDAKDRGANVKIFEEEPRDMLEKHAADKFYKLIVVESYKLPVIEVHKELMTKEALALLMSKLQDDGIVAFHTSNRYYQLPPIIASAAKELKLACIVGKDLITGEDDEDFRFSSEWVMVARDAKYLANLKNDLNNKILWHPAKLTKIVDGKLVEKKIDREFLWTDKGEQSFRGLYRSDPNIDKLYDVVADITDFLHDKAVLSRLTIEKIARPIRTGIGAWSKSSADRLNREPAKEAAPKNDKSFSGEPKERHRTMHLPDWL